MANLSGFHYLSFIFSRISGEEEPLAIEERQTRKSNVYTGTLGAPWAGVPFTFGWRLVQGGELNLASQAVPKPVIAWRLTFYGMEEENGRHKFSSTSGTALFEEISKVEAKMAKLIDDNPGAGKIAKMEAWRIAIQAARDANTILPQTKDTLQDLYTAKGI